MTTKHTITRRQALQMGVAAALGAACSSGSKDVAKDVSTAPDTVTPPHPSRSQSLLEWIFETPADDLVVGAVEKLNGGLAYNELVAGMLAATVTPTPLEMHRRAGIFAAHHLGRELAAASAMVGGGMIIGYFTGFISSIVYRIMTKRAAQTYNKLKVVQKKKAKATASVDKSTSTQSI